MPKVQLRLCQEGEQELKDTLNKPGSLRSGEVVGGKNEDNEDPRDERSPCSTFIDTVEPLRRHPSRTSRMSACCPDTCRSSPPAQRLFHSFRDAAGSVLPEPAARCCHPCRFELPW